MANYIGVSRTNYFRVTDEARYAELFADLSAEDVVQDFTYTKDGVTYHGFGAFASIDYVSERDEDGEAEEWDFEVFLAELQKILPDDEAFMYFESGYEKLRYVSGFTIVVTAREIRSMALDTWAKAAAKELLGEGFNTVTEY